MSEMFKQLVDKATVPVLKNILRSLGLKTDGTKAVLKLRVEKAVESYTDENLEKLAQDFMADGEQDNADSSTEHESEEETLDESPVHALRNDVDEELNKLREACRKREEIISLKRRLKELQMEDNEENHSQRSHVSQNFKDMEDLLCPFTGDDNFPIVHWVEQFEENAESLQLNDRTKFIFGKRLLGGTARLFVRSLKIRNWTHLRDALLGEFKRTVTKADIFSELSARKRRREETLQQYVLSMQEIASHNPIEEEDLIQFIIKGIPDSELNKSMLYNANNIDQLKIALRKYEKYKLNSRDHFPLKSSTSQFHNSSRNNQKNNAFKKKEYTSNAPANVSCAKKEFTCFKCGVRGHIAKNCSSNKPVLIVSESNNNSHHPQLNSADNNEDVLNVDNIHAENINNVSKRSSGRIMPKCSPISNDFEKEISYIFTDGHFECACTLTSLLDSGSPISFVQEKFLPQTMISPLDKDSHTYCGVNNSPLQVLGSVNSRIFFDNNKTNLCLLVVKNQSMNYPIVLGRNFIDRIGMVLKKADKSDEKQDRILPVTSSDRCNRSSGSLLPSSSSSAETLANGKDLSSSSLSQCRSSQVDYSCLESNCHQSRSGKEKIGPGIISSKGEENGLHFIASQK